MSLGQDYADGGYALKATATDGLTADGSLKDSTSRLVNAMFHKTSDDLDDAIDGATYKKVAGVSAGNLIQTASIGDAQVTKAKTESRSRAKAYHASAQSINNNTFTTLAFDSEEYDSASLHDTSTNNSRLTVPSGGDTGTWMLIAQVGWASGSTGTRRVQILKNGNAIADALQINAAGVTIQSVVAIVNAPSVGDYFEVSVHHTQGAALNVSGGVQTTWFQAIHVW